MKLKSLRLLGIKRVKQTLVLGIASALLASHAHAQVSGGIGDALGLSPYWDWKTIETEHFRLTFPKELEPKARKAADYFEEAYRLLTPKLHWRPFHTTQVLVIDNADSANGITSPVARFGIALFVTPPENWFSTNYYDDWLRLLVLHEFTHLVNMDTTEGLYEAGRYIFGDVFLPNAAWPSWMLEGLAVYMETRLTHSGRGRSPYFEAILRAAVDEGKLDTPRFITLDKINGRNPWFPTGETPYIFGYEMMNQFGQSVIGKPVTADSDSGLSGPDSGLGEMSYRSGHRVPFFINGNAENISGKDWYAQWDDWVSATRARMTQEIRKIKSEPITRVAWLTRKGVGVFGSAVSPDGHWIAYTEESSDERAGLYLKDLKTGKTRKLIDKTMGVGLAFSQDSKRIFLSALARRDEYYLYSDLAVYDLESDHRTWLSNRLRAKDPDLSPDGSKLVFTLTDHAGTSLAVAPLIKNGDDNAVGPVRRIYVPQENGRVSTPKFERDGRSVVFSLHLNGRDGEDLMRADLTSGRIETLVSDGHMNRFPSVSPDGRIYFVSDKTGVDNLYRLSGHTPEQVSNVVTGLWLPTISRGQAVASILSTDGWDLAQINILDHPVSSAKVTVDPAPAPAPEKPSPTPPSESAANASKYPTKDYSVYPSILPRQWFPWISFDNQGNVYALGEVSGFDAVDRHRYALVGLYDSHAKDFDWLAAYSNRSFGPTLILTASDQIVGTTLGADLIEGYVKKRSLAASLSYPFLWTYSSLTPSVSARVERERIINPFHSLRLRPVLDRYVPSGDAELIYTATETSELAISPESGRTAHVGARHFFDSYQPSWKGFASDREYFRITQHTILTPYVRGTYTSRTRGDFLDANAIVSGRASQVLNPLEQDSLDSLAIRGYPGATFYTRGAALGSLDYRFPVLRMFRGWGTNPVFFDNLHGFVFYEGANLLFPRGRRAYAASAGTGLDLDTQFLLFFPITFSVQYHHGFNAGLGGKGEVFFSLALSNPLSF